MTSICEMAAFSGKAVPEKAADPSLSPRAAARCPVRETALAMNLSPSSSDKTEKGTRYRNGHVS